VRAEEPLTEVEEAELIRRLNAPKYYFNEGLRRAYRDRNGNLIDFIRAALGTFKIKGREEKLEENFHWLVSAHLPPASSISLYQRTGNYRVSQRLKTCSSRPFNPGCSRSGMELFGQQGLRDIFDELNQSSQLEQRAERNAMDQEIRRKLDRITDILWAGG